MNNRLTRSNIERDQEREHMSDIRRIKLILMVFKVKLIKKKFVKYLVSPMH